VRGLDRQPVFTILRWLHSHVFVGDPVQRLHRQPHACLRELYSHVFIGNPVQGFHRHAPFVVSLVFVGFIRMSSLGHPVQRLPRQASCVVFMGYRL